MDRFSKLVIASLALLSGAANAGYANLAPPAGFGGSPGNWTFAPSANDLRYGGTAYSPNALRVPGTSTTMSAAYRFAANAPRIATGIIFANPYLRAGAAAAAWLGVGKIIWDEAEKIWKKSGDEELSEFIYGTDAWGRDYAPFLNHSSPESVCRAFFDAQKSGYIEWVEITSGPTTCYARGYSIPAGWENLGADIYQLVRPCPVPLTNGKCIIAGSPVPLTKEQFEQILAPEIWSPSQPGIVPSNFPEAVPGRPLPVDPPVINPEPGPDPQPRPLFVPTGDPLPNPQYDPNSPPGPNNQPYVQPGVRLNPSPTPSEPWRVDLQPVNRPVASPEPMPEPDSETPENPDKPSEEEIDFCAKNPDVLACQKLDEPANEELPASEKQISISPDGGWGADNASCPAPKQITVQGRAIPIPFDLFCTWANGMRPIIIAMAWLSAAFILLGARTES